MLYWFKHLFYTVFIIIDRNIDLFLYAVTLMMIFYKSNLILANDLEINEMGKLCRCMIEMVSWHNKFDLWMKMILLLY